MTLELIFKADEPPYDKVLFNRYIISAGDNFHEYPISAVLGDDCLTTYLRNMCGSTKEPEASEVLVGSDGSDD